MEIRDSGRENARRKGEPEISRVKREGTAMFVDIKLDRVARPLDASILSVCDICGSACRILQTEAEIPHSSPYRSLVHGVREEASGRELEKDREAAWDG